MMDAEVVGKEKPTNLIKQIAVDLLPSVFKSVGLDDTAANREDILALALNKLPVKYVTTGSGRLYASSIENFRVQYEADVLASLIRAAMQVKDMPRGSKKTGER